MSQVHARFRLDQVTRGTGYYKAKVEDEYKPVEAASVKMSAVQGPPFGSATPSGSVDMFIVNPGASEMFLSAKIGQEFDVLFSPVPKEQHV